MGQVVARMRAGPPRESRLPGQVSDVGLDTEVNVQSHGGLAVHESRMYTWIKLGRVPDSLDARNLPSAGPC